MIKGVGTDIVKIQRIENMAKHYGDKFLKRVYSEEEILYTKKFKNPFEHLAGKFAAKEAVIKASGIKLPLNQIEILNEDSEKPYTKIKNVKISISHEKEYAIAIAICEEE